VVVISGVLLGLLFNVSPGPINVETVQRGLRGAFWCAVGIQLGGIIGELVYALLALAGSELLVRNGIVQTLLGLVGMGLLLFLGGSSLREGWRGRKKSSSGQTRQAEATSPFSLREVRRCVGLGIAISLSSPFGIAFWLSVGGTALHQANGNVVGFLAGFVVGSLFWAMGLPLLVRMLRASREEAVDAISNVVAIACGLALIFFGLALGVAMIRPTSGGQALVKRAIVLPRERSSVAHGIVTIRHAALHAPSLRRLRDKGI
jgi:chemosensory pili system protein ChpE